MNKCALLMTLLAVLSTGAGAGENEEAQSAYCKYVSEQAAAQRDSLRSPSLMMGPTQPDTGTPPQMVFGLTMSLADVRTSSLTMKTARTSCALNTALSEAQQHIYYAMSMIERDVQEHRLALIERASTRLDKMATEEARLVEVHNLTRPAVYYLQSARERLDMSRTTALAGITLPYVPNISNVPLRSLIAEKQRTELASQKTITNLQKESGWDIRVAAGGRRQLTQFSSPSTASAFGAFGEFYLTYNLARHSANEHFSRSVAAYVEWKANKFDDVTQQALALKSQIEDSIGRQREQLAILLNHNADITRSLESVEGVDTTSAFAFKNQLLADQIVLGVDIDDIQFRLDRLESYLRDNF